MRILFVQDTDWMKQNPHQQHHLAEMLSRRGNEVCVIDCEIPQKNEGNRGSSSKRKVFENVHRIYKDANVTLIRVDIKNIPFIKYTSLFFSYRREIRRQIKDFKPEVIVGWGIVSSYLAVNAAKKEQIPFIYYWTSVLHLLIPNRLLRRLGMVMEKKIFERAGYTLTTNENLKDYAISLGATPDQTKAIGAGIDFQQFDYRNHGMNIRRKYGLNNLDRILFFMGDLYHFSGLDDVISAIPKAGDFRLKLLVVGEGEALEDLEVLRGRYKLDGRVILLGRKDYSELPGLVATADICIYPSDPSKSIFQDSVPIEIYEYMSMKKPVISTKLPGIMREFGKGNGVIYVENPRDVVQAAQKLLNSSYADFIRSGLAAWKKVERNSWENITNQFEEVLENLAVGSLSE